MLERERGNRARKNINRLEKEEVKPVYVREGRHETHQEESGKLFVANEEGEEEVMMKGAVMVLVKWKSWIPTTLDLCQKAASIVEYSVRQLN